MAVEIASQHLDDACKHLTSVILARLDEIGLPVSEGQELIWSRQVRHQPAMQPVGRDEQRADITVIVNLETRTHIQRKTHSVWSRHPQLVDAELAPDVEEPIRLVEVTL